MSSRRIASFDFKNLVGDLFDDLGARIVILIDAMAEAHQAPFAAFDFFDKLGNFFLGADLHEHPQNRFVGAAVQRSIERGGSGGNGRIGIDLRAADAAHRVGAAILFVVGVQE